MTTPFVPAEFIAPTHYESDGFRLEPLGPEHNERDYAAWTSSVDHIRSTPGFEEWDWPKPMTIDANLADLERHARDFANRDGFTYSILEGDEVIGCVYIYPAHTPGHDASVSSWVRETRSDIDITVWQSLSAWLAAHWPFTNPDYAPRK